MLGGVVMVVVAYRSAPRRWSRRRPSRRWSRCCGCCAAVCDGYVQNATAVGVHADLRPVPRLVRGAAARRGRRRQGRHHVHRGDDRLRHRRVRRRRAVRQAPDGAGDLARRSPGRASPARPSPAWSPAALLVVYLLDGDWWVGVVLGADRRGDGHPRRPLRVGDQARPRHQGHEPDHPGPRRPDGPARLAAGHRRADLAAAALPRASEARSPPGPRGCRGGRGCGAGRSRPRAAPSRRGRRAGGSGGRPRGARSRSRAVAAITRGVERRLGELAAAVDGEERREPDLEVHPGAGAALAADVLDDLGGQDVDRGGDLVGRRRGSAGRSSRGRGRGPPTGCRRRVALLTPRPSRPMCGPVLGPNSATSGSSGVSASWRTVSMPRPARRSEIRLPMPQSSLVGRSPITANQLSRVSRNIPRGLPNSVAILARTLVSPMPTEQCSLVASEHVGLDRAGDRLRVVGLDADERLVPAEHLDDRAGDRAQGVHHDGRGRVVRRLVDRQQHGLGARRTAILQRHPRPDPELAGLVGRRRDHAALGRVAAAADDHRQPGQLGATEDLHRRDELVHVDMEHPAGHAPSCRRPTARHAIQPER